MNTLLNKSKPLLIHGNPGSGKTHVALGLVNDMVLTKIDSSMLKSIKNKNYILDIVKKRNITLMFSEKKEKRCLLIDDIHLFQKYDKIFFKMIIEFIKAEQYYQTNIILTCNNSFLKNKELLKLNKYINYHEIKYTYSQYYKHCLELAKKENIILGLNSFDELDKKVYFSGYNFNTFLSTCNPNNIDKKDNYDPIEIVTYNLMRHKIKLTELFRICEGDEIILAYNILENIDRIIIVDKSKYNKIYQRYVDSDIIEYNLIRYDKECIKYMSILAITNINYYINNAYTNPIMNRYISKCMVLTNTKRINRLDFKLYLYDSYIKYKNENEKYKKELSKIDKKEQDKITKIYDIFYSGI
jgi:hypothetical protein|tara:strand:- start:34 stop:1101 length:1068 start_codon:yes stop_codon:yes gene_type:complete